MYKRHSALHPMGPPSPVPGSGSQGLLSTRTHLHGTGDHPGGLTSIWWAQQRPCFHSGHIQLCYGDGMVTYLSRGTKSTFNGWVCRVGRAQLPFESGPGLCDRTERVPCGSQKVYVSRSACPQVGVPVLRSPLLPTPACAAACSPVPPKTHFSLTSADLWKLFLPSTFFGFILFFL